MENQLGVKFKTIKEILKVLGPLYDTTVILSIVSYSTMSMVISILEGINDGLGNVHFDCIFHIKWLLI